jgi:hypothetical protein
VLRKVGKMLFHPEPIKVRKNGKNGKVELKE